VGDWFHCTTLDCGTLGLKGSRFNADGTVAHLYPEKQVLDAAGKYCVTVNPDLTRTWARAGDDLVITDNNGATLRYVFVIEGDVARVTREGKTQHMKRVDPPRDNGPCSKRTPWVCPSGMMDSTGGACQARWTCDNGTFKVDCKKNSSGYNCQCIEAGAAQKSFSSTGLCGQVDLSALIKETNAGCGWQLSLPL